MTVMKIIKITEEKKEKLSEYVEKMLRYGGKAMQCIEELGEDSMGERYDDDDDWDDEDMMGYRYGGGMGERRYRRENGGMGERRSRRTGRFIR